MRKPWAWMAAMVMASGVSADTPAPSGVTAEIVSIEYMRGGAHGLEGAPDRPGTRVKIILSQNGADWRVLDAAGSRITSFVDDRGGNLGLPEAVDSSGFPPGIDPAASRVSGDGKRALVTVWGSGLPVDRAERFTITGSINLFCGGPIETSVERPDIRLMGGETFNVQPFRVVTGRGDDNVMPVELRFLKNSGVLQRVTMMSPSGPMPLVDGGRTADAGEEWVWRGAFERPNRQTTGTLTITFLPIDRSVLLPLNVDSGIAFGHPPKNKLLRWLRQYL